MSRALTKDYKELVDFISTYSISSNVSNKEYNNILSQLHKRYYAQLVFLSELISSGFDRITASYGLDESASKTLQVYLRETSSDLGYALFNWIHGAYKTERILVRCSIENFIKGICAVEKPSIAQLSSTRTAFLEARKLELFSLSENKNQLNNLRSTYRSLCYDVHTAGQENMAQLSALNYFPGFDKESASNSAIIFIRVVDCYLTLLCLSFKSFFLDMHHTNLDIILSILPKKTKLLIYDPH